MLPDGGGDTTSSPYMIESLLSSNGNGALEFHTKSYDFLICPNKFADDGVDESGSYFFFWLVFPIKLDFDLHFQKRGNVFMKVIDI